MMGLGVLVVVCVVWSKLEDVVTSFLDLIGCCRARDSRSLSFVSGLEMYNKSMISNWNDQWCLLDTRCTPVYVAYSGQLR